jgi:hypothetical protein
MAANAVRKRRLEELLHLAQTYQGCNRKELARQLGRDASNLVPESGVPKVDLVVELARVLDWPVEAVIDAMWTDVGALTNGAPEASQPEGFEAIDAAALAAHHAGRYGDMVNLARRAFQAARDGEERAKACNREAGGWDGMGRYRNAQEALQRGLRERGATRDRRLLLQSNLANSYYTLWQLVEGRSVAGDVISAYLEQAPATKTAAVARATAYYVRGNCHRRMIEAEPERAAALARAAIEDLDQARRHFLDLARTHQDDSYAGIAHTCEGGILEAQVVLGERKAGAVLDQIIDALDALSDPATWPSGDWLESWGWWCIIGCNVALRHIDDQIDLQHRMAILTNKADEIASRLGNWSMRERIFTMEYARRERFCDWSGVEIDWTVDNDDVRVIAGTMGRFPGFQETGWRILRTARYVKEN